MNRAAHITSLDAIREFRRELSRYEEAIREVVEMMGLEARRASDWIEHDRTRYWPAEVRRGEDKVVAARSDLELAKLAAMQNENKSCIDEKKAVDRAVDRLRLCEEKVKVVRGWRQKMRHQSEEFDGKLARLVHYLDVDLPRAIAALDRVIKAVEKYSETNRAPSPTGRITVDPVNLAGDATGTSGDAGTGEQP